MGRFVLDQALVAELASIAEVEGCELVHAEFSAGTLRLILDRPEGVNLEDCQRVSHQVSAILDVAGFGAGRYTLEVSSPGLDRPLYSPKDYERFIGKLARVTLREPETGGRRTVVGRLQAFDGERVTLVEEKTTKQGIVPGDPVTVPLAVVEKARLEIEL